MPQRSLMLPVAPPISEVLQGFDASPINYVAVRAGTLKAIIDRLSSEINAVLRSPEVKSTLEATGVMPRGSTPAEMADLVKNESAKWKRVIELSWARIDGGCEVRADACVQQPVASDLKQTPAVAGV